MKSFFSIILLALSLFGTLAFAQQSEPAPKLINYQGKLTDAGGDELQPGQYVLRFKLFDATSGGVLIWGEEREVAVVGGVFNVILGGAGAEAIDGVAVNNLEFAFGGANRFLETTIVSGPQGALNQTLLPRQQLLSVPFALSASNGVPVGTVLPLAGLAVPDGWVECNGGTYPINEPQYARLHAAIQNIYNRGDEPAGHFRVPDMKGRAPIGRGKGDTWIPGGNDQSTNRLLGQKLGAERHQLTIAEMPSHGHGVNDPGHTHQWGEATKINNIYGSGSARSAWAWFGAAFQSTSLSYTGITIQAAGGNQPHNNMQPSLVLNYIIKL